MHEKTISSKYKGEEFLETKGIRPTAMRLLVLDFLLQQQAAVSLNNVEEAFAKSERTTLYRTIKTFEEKGLVHQVPDETGIARYALCKEACIQKKHKDSHLHFHCITCDKTFWLVHYKIPPINLPKGYQAEEVNLLVKGCCENCKEQ